VDAIAAAREYEAAAALDEGYLQAWVGLALAWTSMGTPDSLCSAIELWRALVDMPVGDDGVSQRCMSILLQNLAYSVYQQYLYTRVIETLQESAECYLRANEMDPDVRPELYYPWCNVLLLLGRVNEAEKLWNIAGLGTPSRVKDVYLDKYTDLSAFDLRWGK
jgi:tetratricopeptide (TPR) repeat protein